MNSENVIVVHHQSKKDPLSSEMDEYELKKRSNVCTPNELNCIRRNRILNKYLLDNISHLSKEHKYNYGIIKDLTNSAEVIHNKVKISTGSAFNDHEYNAELIRKMSENVDKNSRFIAKKYLKTLTGLYTESLLNASSDENTKTENNEKKRKSVMSTVSSRPSTCLLSSRKSTSKGPRKELNNLASQSSIDRFIDQSNMVSYKARAKTAPMRPIRPLNQTNPKIENKKLTNSYASFKQKSMIEWNKYPLKRKDSYEDFEFQDREFYGSYLELCEKRDSLPIVPSEKITNSLKRDPIFNKRYRQYLYAKSCNRAPIFDDQDNTIPHLIPKYTLQKKKQEIINENNFKEESIKNFYKIELELITEKTKKFLKEIEI